MKLKISKTPHQKTCLLFRNKTAQPALMDFKGDPGETCVRYDGERTLVFCGLGGPSATQARMVRTAAAKGIQKALDLKRTEVSVDCTGIAAPGLWKAALESNT